MTNRNTRGTKGNADHQADEDLVGENTPTERPAPAGADSVAEGAPPAAPGNTAAPAANTVDQQLEAVAALVTNLSPELRSALVAKLAGATPAAPVLPTAAAAAPAQASSGNTAAPATSADTVDQQLTALSVKLPPELLSVLATIHARQRAVEQHVQAARGEQVAVRDQVIDLHRVVSQNADAIDQLAEMMAPVPADAPAAAAAPAAPVKSFTPPPERPPVPEHSGFGLGGIAGRRRDRGVRRFAPGAPVPAAPAIVAVVQLPPHNPRASAPPAALPAVSTPVRPDAVLLDEMHIDPRKLGPGEHELTTPGGRPVLVRVREQARPGALRRQGGGRTFRPSTPAAGNTGEDR